MLALRPSPLLSAMPSVAPPTLLVVKDTSASVGVIRDALRREGVCAFLATSDGATREALARTLPNLVLLDTMMPDKARLAARTALRTHPVGRGLPISSLTSIAIAEQKVRAFGFGAGDYAAPVVAVVGPHRHRAHRALRTALTGTWRPGIRSASAVGRALRAQPLDPHKRALPRRLCSTLNAVFRIDFQLSAHGSRISGCSRSPAGNGLFLGTTAPHC